MANGWTAERRAKQALMIQQWRPWDWSTGPKTISGKEAASKNARVHGWYDCESKAWRKHCADLLRQCRELKTAL